MCNPFYLNKISKPHSFDRTIVEPVTAVVCSGEKENETSSKEEEEVKVLGLWVSPFSNRILIALEEVGIAYHCEQQDLSNKSPQLLQANPIHKKVPVLLHNGKPICESLVILHYIAETWAPHILPSHPYDRALARFWADFIDNKFWTAWKIIMLSGEGEAKEQAKRECIDAVLMIEGALNEISGGKPYFGGDQFGYLDVVFAPFICLFHAAEVVGNMKFPLDDCRALNAWIKVVSERDSVKKIVPDAADAERVIDHTPTMRKVYGGE